MTAKGKAAVAAAVVLVLLGGALVWKGGWAGEELQVSTAPPAPTLATAPVAAHESREAEAVPASPAPAVRRPLLVLDPDGRPLPGATVDCIGIRTFGADEVVPVARALGMADAEGRLPWPTERPAFPCVVRASAGEFAPGEALASGPEEDLVLRLGRGYALEGEVVDADGAPVSGASVTAVVVPMGNVLGAGLGVTGTLTRTARSGADGRFRVGGLPPSTTGLVTAGAPGYMESRVAWQPFAGRGLRVVLERPFRSVVRVRDRSGRAVEGASVWVFHGPRLAVSRWLTPQPAVLPLPATGPGEYGRDDLPAGWYWVLVAAKGYRLVVDEEAGFGRGLPPVEITIEEVPGLRGRVVWYDTREPVAGVQVRATPLRKGPATMSDQNAHAYAWPVREMDGPFVTTTGADGTYELPVFGPSDRLQVEARDDEGSRGFVDHPPYPKTEAEELGDIWLHRLGKDREVDYRGRVVGKDGQPVGGALVQGYASVVTAGPDGKFHLDGKQPGTNLQFMAPGFFARTVFAPGTTPTGGGFGTQDFGDVVLARLVELHGTVVDAAGAPLPGTMVWAEPRNRAELGALFKEFRFTGASGMADDRGEVTIRVVSGPSYTVRAFEGPQRGTVAVDGQAGEEFQLVLQSDARLQGGSISGHLRLADGTWKPCRVTIGLLPEDGGSSSKGLSGEVDPEGAFEISGVPEGHWTLRVSGSEDVAGELADVAVAAGGNAQVEIPCRWLQTENDGVVEVHLSPAPPPEKAGGLLAWVTLQPAGRSEPLAAREDGSWGAKVRAGAPVALYACDPKGTRAGVFTGTPPADGAAVPVRLVPAGILLPPGWEYGTPEPWVEVQDAAGTVVYTGGMSALPVVPDSGYALVLPPGSYRIEISVGVSRKDPRSFTATSVVGSPKRLQ